MISLCYRDPFYHALEYDILVITIEMTGAGHDVLEYRSRQ